MEGGVDNKTALYQKFFQQKMLFSPFSFIERFQTGYITFSAIKKEPIIDLDDHTDDSQA